LPALPATGVQLADPVVVVTGVQTVCTHELPAVPGSGVQAVTPTCGVVTVEQVVET
jgi:hypothetical protein